MFITAAPEAVTAAAPAPVVVPVPVPLLVPVPVPDPDAVLDPVRAAAATMPLPEPQPAREMLAVHKVIKAMAIERREFTMKVPVSICGYVLRTVAAEVRSLGQDVRNGPVMRGLDTEGGGLV
jgi:hypothetical protein